MTTVTNFIEGNFIVNPQPTNGQSPLWLIKANSSSQSRLLISQLISRCQLDRKPLIHLDLSLNAFLQLSKVHSHFTSENAVTYSKLYEDKPYYLIDSPIKSRKIQKYLPNLLSGIDKDVQFSQKLTKSKQQCISGSTEFGLLIEGLQTFALLLGANDHSLGDLQAFINQLANLSPNFRQIVVIIQSHLLSAEVNFALQRISTCLTNLQSFKNQQWECISTIRRFTGYSKQEHYTIKIIKQGYVKVTKKKTQKNENAKTAEQVQLMGNLGFKAQKTQSHRQQEQQLKQMIFPHLKMRNQCERQQACSSSTCCKNANEDLFVLDDEQQDDDDIDV